MKLNEIKIDFKKSIDDIVSNYKPPIFPNGGGGTDGDIVIQHKGKNYFFTGKSGKNLKTGLASYEYSYKNESVESRIWIQVDGKIEED